MVMDWVTRWEGAARGRTSSLSAEPILLTVMRFRWLHSPAKKNETENFSANTGHTDYIYIYIQYIYLLILFYSKRAIKPAV